MPYEPRHKEAEAEQKVGAPSPRHVAQREQESWELLDEEEAETALDVVRVQVVHQPQVHAVVHPACEQVELFRVEDDTENEVEAAEGAKEGTDETIQTRVAQHAHHVPTR